MISDLYLELIAERQQLLERIKTLEAENAELRKRLGEEVITATPKPTAMQKLSPQEKVDLFRSLFKGRSDVLLEDGTTRQVGKRVINLYVRTNGGLFAIERATNVQNAPTASSCP